MYPSKNVDHIIAGHIQEALEGEYTTWRYLWTATNVPVSTNWLFPLTVRNNGYCIVQDSSGDDLLLLDPSGGATLYQDIEIPPTIADYGQPWRSILSKYTVVIGDQAINPTTVYVFDHQNTMIWNRNVTTDEALVTLFLFGAGISPNGRFILVTGRGAGNLLYCVFYEGS